MSDDRPEPGKKKGGLAPSPSLFPPTPHCGEKRCADYSGTELFARLATAPELATVCAAYRVDVATGLNLRFQM